MMTTSDWWETFLDTHGRDSEVEKTFLGYLTNHGIDGLSASPEVLADAYTGFQAFMAASDAEAGPAPVVFEARVQASGDVDAAENAVETPVDPPTVPDEATPDEEEHKEPEEDGKPSPARSHSSRRHS